VNVVYVTGNKDKAKYFSELVGLEIPKMKLDIDEIQSINPRKIIEHKAKQAFSLAKCPVIIEDTKLNFSALGKLPGPFIKWFLSELGEEGLCRMLDGYNDRSATAGSLMAYYNGTNLHVFEGEIKGRIAKKPRGSGGFGWNKIFIPKGTTKTLAQMNETEFKKYYIQFKPFDKLAKFLQYIDIQ
jgi:inosine triphosphate pyrophosphatase